MRILFTVFSHLHFWGNEMKEIFNSEKIIGNVHLNFFLFAQLNFCFKLLNMRNFSQATWVGVHCTFQGHWWDFFLHILCNNINRSSAGGYLLCRCCTSYCRLPSNPLLYIIITVPYCLSEILKILPKFQWDNYHNGTMDISLAISARDLASKGLSRNCSCCDSTLH